MVRGLAPVSVPPPVGSQHQLAPPLLSPVEHAHPVVPSAPPVTSTLPPPDTTHQPAGALSSQLTEQAPAHPVEPVVPPVHPAEPVVPPAEPVTLTQNDRGSDLPVQQQTPANGGELLPADSESIESVEMEVGGAGSEPTDMGKEVNDDDMQLDSPSANEEDNETTEPNQT